MEAKPEFKIVKPIAVDIAMFCALASIGRTMAYKLISERAVESYRLGGKRLIMLRSIETLLHNLIDPTPSGEQRSGHTRLLSGNQCCPSNSGGSR